MDGPLSSAIATLIDFGWTVPELSQWTSPDGALWQIDFTAPNEASPPEVLMHSTSPLEQPLDEETLKLFTLGGGLTGK